MADVLHMKTFEEVNWELEVEHTLQTIAWVFRTTIPSTTPHNPGNLSFERSMIMSTRIKIDWELVKKMRCKNVIKNSIKENKDRLEHECALVDLVYLIKSKDERHKERKLDKPTEGSYEIIIVYSNAEVTIQRNDYLERITVRRLKPHNNN